VSMIGVVHTSLLDSLLGSVAYCLMFRRPMFALLSSIYSEGPHDGRSDTLFKLSRRSREELLLVAVLLNCSITDLRVKPDSHLYCVDASLHGAGACSCKVPTQVSASLWQFGDHRGQRSTLLLPGEAYERACGGPEDGQCDDGLSSCDDEDSDSLDPEAEGARYIVSHVPPLLLVSAASGANALARMKSACRGRLPSPPKRTRTSSVHRLPKLWPV
jgi:hypothetical protein